MTVELMTPQIGLHSVDNETVAVRATVQIETITPEQAAEYLKNARPNRNLRQPVAKRYSGLMNRGMWQVGDPIKFDRDGQMGDGQHRMWAVVDYGHPVDFLVVRDLPDEAFDQTDTGVKRTVGDVLTLHGYSNAMELGATARLVMAHRATGTLGRERIAPSPDQVLDLLRNEPELVSIVSRAKTIRRADRLGLPDSRIAAFLFLFGERTDDEEAEAFFQELLYPPDPTAVTALLRKRLLAQRPGHELSMVMRDALTVKAWNAWLSGDRPRLLRWSAGGSHAEEFPTILGWADLDDDVA